MATKEIISLNAALSRLETGQTGDVLQASQPLSVQELRFPDGSVQTSGTSAVGGGYQWVVKAAAYTAASNVAVLADTTAGAFAVTLPAGVLGARVFLSDGASTGSWAANRLTVARNGADTIDGAAADLVLGANGGWAELVYDGTTWQSRVGTSRSWVSIPLTGTSTNLTMADVAGGGFEVTGALATSDHTLNLPAGFVGSLHILNNTTNDFAVNIVQTATVELPRGVAWPVVSDGTNVWSGQRGVIGFATTTIGNFSYYSATGSAFTATGLSATLTPKMKTSTLIVSVDGTVLITGGTQSEYDRTLYLNGVDVIAGANGIHGAIGDGTQTSGGGYTYQQTSGSLTAATFAEQILKVGTGTSTYNNYTRASHTQTMTVMEVV